MCLGGDMDCEALVLEADSNGNVADMMIRSLPDGAGFALLHGPVCQAVAAPARIASRLPRVHMEFVLLAVVAVVVPLGCW
eukprot:5257008-Amphidinium_carterae.1